MSVARNVVIEHDSAIGAGAHIEEKAVVGTQTSCPPFPALLLCSFLSSLCCQSLSARCGENTRAALTELSPAYKIGSKLSSQHVSKSRLPQHGSSEALEHLLPGNQVDSR